MKSPNSYKKELFIGVPKNNLLVTGVLKNNYKNNYKIVYFEILTDILITIPWYDPSPPSMVWAGGYWYASRNFAKGWSSV